MALADRGDFNNARTCAQNALQLATQTGLVSTNEIRLRLELYEKNQPWRESFRFSGASVTNQPDSKLRP